jgi:hypothetical protein
MSSNPPFPAPGTVLWAVDVDLERDVFRSGAASKPNVEYLRFIDLGISEREGRIPDDEAETFTVDAGQGISLFLERLIPEGLVVVDPASANQIDKKKQKKIHWWGVDQKHPIPSGLELVYDGHPPGHCTLTVSRRMTVKAFLSLVAQVPFSLRFTDIVAPLH